MTPITITIRTNLGSNDSWGALALSTENKTPSATRPRTSRRSERGRLGGAGAAEPSVARASCAILVRLPTANLSFADTILNSTWFRRHKRPLERNGKGHILFRSNRDVGGRDSCSTVGFHCGVTELKFGRALDGPTALAFPMPPRVGAVNFFHGARDPVQGIPYKIGGRS